MKIERVEIAANKMMLRKPFKIALGVITEVSNLTIKVITDTGDFGIGEATPEPLVTGETLEGCEAALKLLADALTGEDPRQLSRIHSIMNQCMKGNGSAKAALDMACYDLLGKSTGLPLYQLLGGQDNQVETDMTISIDTPEVMAENAQLFVEQGFTALKIKVGLDEKDDIERVKQIRAAVGPAIELRIDANQGWRAKQAIKMIEQLQKYDIAFCEQPRPIELADGYQDALPLPLFNSCSHFKQQIDFLKAEKYHTLTLEEVKDYYLQKKALPEKAVLLTFDDCYQSMREYAYPLLKEAGFKATAFVVSGWLFAEPSPYKPAVSKTLSRSELNEMSDVFEYANHTTHFHERKGMMGRSMWEPAEKFAADFMIFMIVGRQEIGVWVGDNEQKKIIRIRENL